MYYAKDCYLKKVKSTNYIYEENSQSFASESNLLSIETIVYANSVVDGSEEELWWIDRGA